MSVAVLEATSVVRRYRNGRGVGPVDLALGAGEVLALLGPNGSGKTTLLRCLATRSRPGSGRVRWFGSEDQAGARARLGVVFDATAHVEELSARTNLEFFAGVRGVVPSGVDPLLEAAELAKVASDPVGSYSYGMRRRLLLAEALAGDPELLLLDEPTLGLDVQGRRWLAEVIADRRERGRVTLLSTNDTEFVEQVASRVAFLLDGRLVHDSPLEELLATVGGRRELLLTCRRAPDRDRLAAIPGVESVMPVEGGMRLTTRNRDGLLAEVLAVVGDLDQNLADLSVRDAGLADCFLRLTGRPLDG